MELGAFSISLAVRDLAASREFYGKLGFEPIGGDGASWQMLRNGTTLLGLFQGLFERNVLTFNPGWDPAQQGQAASMDVRDIRRALAARGLEVQHDTTGRSPEGPGAFLLVDPDGNPVLIDQHV